jgi:Delta7-sterol 5-desaturase
MFDAVAPIQITRKLGPAMFAIHLARYLIVASMAATAVWYLRRTRYKVRTIQTRNATSADRRREVIQSTKTLLVFTVNGILVIWGSHEGVFRYESHGVWIDLAVLTAMVLAHESYFYWTHRLMHHPKLFKLIHREHHRSITPTVWGTYSFAFPEAVVQTFFLLLWLFFVPTPAWVMVTWLNLQLLRGAISHVGYEFFPRWWLATPLVKWVATPTHHDLHHAGGFSHNYGFYFTWWDEWMGTEHPQYQATFQEVVTRPQVGFVTGKPRQQSS